MALSLFAADGVYGQQTLAPLGDARLLRIIDKTVYLLALFGKSGQGDFGGPCKQFIDDQWVAPNRLVERATNYRRIIK